MKKTGILLPIFSLPSEYGIGTFGKSAYEFVDFLAEAHQSYWQILPLNPTGFGDSPYQSPSAFAGNPYFIDPEFLVRDAYLKKEDLNSLTKTRDKIDYGIIYNERFPLLRKAFLSFRENVPEDFFVFLKRESYWLENFALFMALKHANGGREFHLWSFDEIHKTDLNALKEKHADEIDFNYFLQYLFDKQWKALKAYANGKGVKIIGDIPIYVSLDSADVFGAPENFLLDKDLKPTLVAGVPPDDFSKDGQLWGNPLYDWDKMRENGYAWWCSRVKRASELYDKIRIDHFLGFSNYFAIPAGEESALSGHIRKGVGYSLFIRIREEVPGASIIAEDLGMLQDGVPELLSATGFPGMKVMQFSLGGKDNPHAPENHVENCVVYTGTHDNPTSLGFYKSLSDREKRKLRARLPKTSRNTLDRFIDYALSTPAETVIIPIQDYLGLGNEARINAPSTDTGNWCWIMPKNYNSKKTISKILAHTGKFNR
ncbi:MAG: 4-alpha-glucanotransferase [Clostridia bacterium]|nr:4-alpha-glucanotransferase [Clostridia bacterium]